MGSGCSDAGPSGQWFRQKNFGSDLVPVEVSFENFIENFGGKFRGEKFDKGNKSLRCLHP